MWSMKKISSAIVLSLLIFAGTAQAGFSDVYNTDANFVAVNSLVDQGILVGYEDGTFLPGNEVNRAEALKIILMGAGITVDESSAAGILFSDVSEDDWFFPYVSTGVSLGIIQGYEDATFRPEQTVNRAEAVKMLLAAAGILGSAEESASSSAPFPDVPVSEWYAPYASYSKTWNIEAPQVDGNWHGADTITRANISEMVYRLQQTDVQGHAFDEAQNWLKKDFPTVNISMKVPFGWGYKQDGVGAAFLLDHDNQQLSLLTPYDNGGTLLMTRYANSDSQSAEELFANIEAHTDLETDETAIGDYDVLVVYHEEGSTYREWYLMLDNGTLLHVLAMRGDGAYSNYLEWYFDAMVASIEYQSSGTTEKTIDEIVEALRGAIQVDGTGTDMMSYLTDWELIETDTIGVGTGPVDYFYSPSANITIKYERSYDVILDLKDGSTSAF